MNINLKMHTILLLVGPNQCGKSTFSNEILEPQLKDLGLKVKYISSDNYRKDLLFTDNLDVNGNSISEIGSLAFELLNKEVDVYSSYPVNSDIIIVDTKGLSSEFREDMAKIAEKNHYNLDIMVFNYKKMGEYYDGVKNKKIIEKQINKLRLNVLKDLSKNKPNFIHSITQKDFLENSDNYKVNVIDKEKYESQYLPSEYDYFIIGDVHEQINELKQLIVKAGFFLDETEKLIVGSQFVNKKILLVGDFIDKGNNTAETLDFLYNNKDWFYFVKGNHERFVYGALKNPSIRFDGDTEFFTSLDFFTNEKNSEYVNKFIELYNLCSEEYIIKAKNESTVHITHSPVEKKYLSKLSKESLKAKVKINVDFDKHNNFDMENFEYYLENDLLHFLTDVDFGERFHVFGHIATKSVYRCGNKIGLDTGVVYGNSLTGVNINRGKAFYYSVQSLNEKSYNLPLIFNKKIKKVNLDDLDRDDWKKINYALSNGVNYVSGTMSPSDKDLDNNDIESLEKGLDYFKDNHVEKVILQPKFMGSRCNLYLFKDDLEKCYAVSRNGYKIRHVDLTHVFESQLKRYFNFMTENNLSFLLIDGELLPWSVLGKGLIEDSFRPLSSLVGFELDLLKEFKFEENLSTLLGREELGDFQIAKNNTNKSELIKKFGSSNYETFKSLGGFINFDVTNESYNLDIYNEQVNIFGNVVKDAYFEGFNILKAEDLNGDVVFIEGMNTFGDMESIFNVVSDNDYLLIDFKDENYLLKAESYFDNLTTERKMEGVVIKPLVYKNNLIPYMKVRNKNYLTLVYGYDYKNDTKYNRLINQKNIKRKLSVSLSENILSRELLKYSLKDINKSNIEYLNALANVLVEVKKEIGIDPRL